MIHMRFPYGERFCTPRHCATIRLGFKFSGFLSPSQTVSFLHRVGGEGVGIFQVALPSDFAKAIATVPLYPEFFHSIFVEFDQKFSFATFGTALAIERLRRLSAHHSTGVRKKVARSAWREHFPNTLMLWQPALSAPPGLRGRE